jgi:nucleoside-diphosphate-sugar epimerase
MSMQVLVTGATGLVGFEVMEALRLAGTEEVVGVSRKRSSVAGGTVAWDMASEPAPAELRGPWDVIVHAAADTRWTMSPADAARANVETVRALVPLVSAGTHLVHVSTAYSIGLGGDISSADLADYRNSYEWSKAHAERLVGATFDRYTIVRPPLIVGRSGDGRAARFAGMYTLLRAMSASMVPVVVADADAYLDVVPVDAVAQVLVEAAQAEGRDETWVVAGGRQAPSVATAVELMTVELNGWREERGLEPFDVPRLVSPESWKRFFEPFVRDELSPRQRSILGLLSNFEPYLEIREPLAVTHQVDGVEGAIATSVRYWADCEHRRASLAPRPWMAAAR